MIVTEEFQEAVRNWLSRTRHRQLDLARMAECDPATITRILRQTGKRLDDTIAERICQIVEYDLPSTEGLCRLALDRLECPVGISSEGRVLYTNAAMARLLGRSAEELVGHDVLDLLGPEGKQDVTERILARDPSPYEVTMLTPKGSKCLRIIPQMLTTHIRMVQAHELPTDE
ncbi:MAG: PAS domain-containing protein [Lentisphaerae bacterium]|jgi:PAS domain-containing protein|nr:PAS domain-containing protein [Lentisphaerota bacterium]